MRKTKQELIGNISFQNHGKFYKTDLYHIGEILMLNYEGMLDASLINNRIFIIDMQQEGIKFHKIFHYRKHDDKIYSLNKYLNCCQDKIMLFLKNHYKLDNIECSLETKEVYDEDYCSLSIEEAKSDLTQEELVEVIEDLAHYQPTLQKKQKKTGQSVYF